LNFRTGELHVCRHVCAVDGKLEISVPKTKSSVRTIVLPPSLVEVLKEYKKTVDSRWMFPSPQNPDSPRYPTGTSDILGRILRRAGCKRVRFHDLRHTFAAMALENGMDVKTLSATTLDIYSHMTDTMQMQAAVNIDRKIGGTDAQMPEPEPPKASEPTPTKATPEKEFEPYKGKISKSGTGLRHHDKRPPLRGTVHTESQR